MSRLSFEPEVDATTDGGNPGRGTTGIGQVCFSDSIPL